jgi:hypothetical protein
MNGTERISEGLNVAAPTAGVINADILIISHLIYITVPNLFLNG